MTRRSFLRRAILILGIHAAGLLGGESSGRAGNAVSGSVRDVLDPPSKSGTLSRAEMEDLVAFAEVLVEGRTLTSAERGYLLEHIEDRTRRRPEYLTLYRTAVSTLDRLAGRRVASLNIRKRIELVARYRLAASEVWPGENLGPFPEQMRTLRTRAVPDLIGGYYGSPAGWAAVGYETFPGRCGDLTRYVRQDS
jgi:hypothetical protein